MAVNLLEICLFQSYPSADLPQRTVFEFFDTYQ